MKYFARPHLPPGPMKALKIFLFDAPPPPLGPSTTTSLVSAMFAKMFIACVVHKAYIFASMPVDASV